MTLIDSICPHEQNGCHFTGYCEHRMAPNKELNGTWLPTCGLKIFPAIKRVAVITIKPECYGNYSSENSECEKCEITTKCIFYGGDKAMRSSLKRI